MVRLRRLELPPMLLDSDLNAARLPIPPQPHLRFAVYSYIGGLCEAGIYIFDSGNHFSLNLLLSR